MPSLVEGFGQVYLEALSRGCPVVGTANTGLLDIHEEGDPIWTVAPGSIDQLVSVLETLAAKIPGDTNIRARARACAARWSWRRFRDGISAALPGA
jgi:glycosyltransferase involved in cell wall biosynthesis